MQTASRYGFMMYTIFPKARSSLLAKVGFIVYGIIGLILDTIILLKGKIYLR